MHSRYKFEWLHLSERPLAFRLSSKQGMVWEGFLNNGKNDVRITDDTIVPGAGIVKVNFTFTKGNNNTLPVKAYRHLNYKIGRSLVGAIKRMVKEYKDNPEDLKQKLLGVS